MLFGDRRIDARAVSQPLAVVVVDETCDLIDVAGRDTGRLKVGFPAVDYTRHLEPLINGFIPRKAEERGLRKRISQGLFKTAVSKLESVSRIVLAGRYRRPAPGSIHRWRG